MNKPAKATPEHLQRKTFFKFIVCGLLCFSFNLLILHVCIYGLGWNYLLAFATSMAIVNSSGFLLNRYWTFEGQRDSFWSEGVRYFSANFSSAAISWLLMILGVSVLGFNPLLSSATIAISLGVANFFVHSFWSFGRRSALSES